jgi:hypothetical protein
VQPAITTGYHVKGGASFTRGINGPVTIETGVQKNRSPEA